MELNGIDGLANEAGKSNTILPKAIHHLVHVIPNADRYVSKLFCFIVLEFEAVLVILTGLRVGDAAKRLIAIGKTIEPKNYIKFLAFIRFVAAQHRLGNLQITIGIIISNCCRLVVLLQRTRRILRSRNRIRTGNTGEILGNAVRYTYRQAIDRCGFVPSEHKPRNAIIQRHCGARATRPLGLVRDRIRSISGLARESR